ncbi:putative ribonuclease H-like domain-containing protein [Tanacetum coccineum]
MAKQAELNNRMSKGSSQREIRLVWNNVQRINHQNQFVPKAVLTRTGKIPVNTARASGTNNVSTARASGTNNICDKKNNILFTNSECLVLSPEFKLPDANQVLLRISRQNNMYSFNIENIVPSGGLSCLIAKATIDESNKWHRRLGHVNFKNIKQNCEGKPCKRFTFKDFSK